MKLCHRTTAKHVKGTPFLDRGSGRRAPEPEDGEHPFNFSIFILFFCFPPSPQLALRCTAIVAVALAWALKTLRQPSLRTQVLGKGVSRVQKVWDAYHLLLALFSLQVALGHPRCSEMCPCAWAKILRETLVLQPES